MPAIGVDNEAGAGHEPVVGRLVIVPPNQQHTAGATACVSQHQPQASTGPRWQATAELAIGSLVVGLEADAQHVADPAPVAHDLGSRMAVADQRRQQTAAAGGGEDVASSLRAHHGLVVGRADDRAACRDGFARQLNRGHGRGTRHVLAVSERLRDTVIVAANEHAPGKTWKTVQSPRARPIVVRKDTVSVAARPLPPRLASSLCPLNTWHGTATTGRSEATHLRPPNLRPLR
jgi:hypothetical protein